MDTATYEEQFGPLRRRMMCAGRWVRWRVKGRLGHPRTLLIELRWRLGDEVMALPIYEALARRYPGTRIAVLCHYPELLDGNPYVSIVNPARLAPDRYVLLRSGPRTVYRLEHYARCVGVPTPVARPRLHYADWTAPQLEALPRGDGPLVAVCAGASWETKRWPIASWRALCREIEGLGCRVVELGAANDEAIGIGTSLLGQTTVREAACVLHACDLLVCCDSGLMHLALAADTRVVALFGPTDPAILIRNEPNLVYVQAAAACRGCWNRADTPDQPGACALGKPTCLAAIGVDEVLASVRRVLGEAR